MDKPAKNSASVGCFSQIGLLAVVVFATLSIQALLLLVPPWVKVQAQRRQILYWSEQVKVHSQTFAGFDFLFSPAKQQRTGPATPPSSEAYFDVTEYQVAWLLLVGEWLVVLMAGVAVFVVVSRRMRRG